MNSLLKFCLKSNFKTKQNHIFQSLKYNFSNIQQFQKQNFEDLCQLFENLGQNTKKDVKISLLCNHLNLQLQTNEYENVINSIKLITCQFQSPQIKGDLQIAEKNIKKILAQIYNIDIEEISNLQSQFGDLSEVGKHLFEKNNQSLSNQESLDLNQFIDKIDNIFLISGNDSMQRKFSTVQNLFKLCKTSIQVKYLIRILLKKLRIGVSQKTLINALQNLSQQQNNNELFREIIKISEQNIFGYNLMIQTEYQNQNEQQQQIIQDNEDAELQNLIKEQFKKESQKNDIDKQKQVKNQIDKQLSYGNPIPVMLAKSVGFKDQLQKILSKFEKPMQCEVKYDGERTQLHFDKKQDLKLFSRRQEIQNEKYPQLVEQVQNILNKINIENCILEGEIVPFDAENNMLEFQSLLSRKQAYERLFIFDLLMINDKTLIQESLPTRKQFLQKHIISNLPKDKNSQLQQVEYRIIDPRNEKEMLDYMKEACDKNLEGLIIKSQEENSIYKSNSRVNWIKLKKFLLKEGQVGDTLDLIPIGVYYGKGKRSGVFGAYLMGCFNKFSRQYEAICKLGTGFSDEFMEQQTKMFNDKNCLKPFHEKPYNFNIVKHLKPDFWISNPDQVWEIQCDSFTNSPSYSIGRTDTMPGISLRFPRFVGLRNDKTVLDSTDTQQIIELAHQDRYFKPLDSTQ